MFRKLFSNPFVQLFYEYFSFLSYFIHLINIFGKNICMENIHILLWLNNIFIERVKIRISGLKS